jgi:hypothetical protein
LSGNKGLQWTIILENFISFPKRKDEFLKDRIGDFGFCIHLSPGLMGLVCEALKFVGPADKDFLISMSQRYRRMMSQQASERMLS